MHLFWLDAFEGSRTSEAENRKENITHATKIEDADTTLVMI